MVCLNRNKVEFYYALYEGKEMITDEYGNQTGEFQVIHGNPIRSTANISPAKGETQTRQFGEEDSYDKVIAADNNTPVLDEFSWLWVDTMPQLNENGSLAVNDSGNIITPHDYDVKKVAKSLNSISYAITKVNVNGN
jgi:cellulose biosynthesis protein BcsQ